MQKDAQWQRLVSVLFTLTCLSLVLLLLPSSAREIICFVGCSFRVID